MSLVQNLIILRTRVLEEKEAARVKVINQNQTLDRRVQNLIVPPHRAGQDQVQFQIAPHHQEDLLPHLQEAALRGAVLQKAVEKDRNL